MWKQGHIFRDLWEYQGDTVCVGLSFLEMVNRSSETPSAP